MMYNNSRDEFIKIAREYLLENIGNDVDIFEEDIEECEDAFRFHYQSKKFLKSGRFGDQYVGPGPLYVLKRNRKVISYGSASLGITARVHLISQINKERLIRIYYKDYDIWEGKYNLIINEITDDFELGIEDFIIEDFVSVLLKHEIWDSSRYDHENNKSYYYTREELEQALKTGPLILKRHFCEKLEDLLVDLINTNIYLDWTLEEIK
ncbi:hypothetical protein [Chryseobacterium arthrosphaerae]|uniref:hypothetical protein n=1 Tax=Chryseobacterium arthrosphaerae TaxID=651561 RepID=UPI0031D06034